MKLCDYGEPTQGLILVKGGGFFSRMFERQKCLETHRHYNTDGG